ncbi:MAG: NADH:ubiquinone reductase (Na(+)-transporting) subunit C [Flavobacteriales bacterium]|jgi:Na+-transporting NADH:ubiquinone oxidoreductase subunit C|nr:NADH:ubiquinone reductase (Na(+)-transporting) subunit C [Flavobacteriales bacterium]
MDRNSNTYTFMFSSILVIVVALILAFVSQATKSKYESNIENEKMQSILATIGVAVDRDKASGLYNDYIKESLTLNADGSLNIGVNAFDINLHKELKKDANKQSFPLYIAEKDGKKYYVIPLYGAGLWDAIWGYVALESDKNTVAGAIFDHKGETPGLGAQITEKWFQEQFAGKTILTDASAGFTDNNFISVRTVKGGAKTDDAHAVDGISGSTKTADGINNMIQERLAHYLIYFQNN